MTSTYQKPNAASSERTKKSLRCRAIRNAAAPLTSMLILNTRIQHVTDTLKRVTTIVYTALLLVGCHDAAPPEPGARLNDSRTSTVDPASAKDEQQLTNKGAFFLHSDGFPTGNETPEGAATDLMRAFINRDAELFHQRRWVISCEGYNDPANAYTNFLAHMPKPITTKANKNVSASSDSQRIGKVYAARVSSKFSGQNLESSKLLGVMGHEAFVDVVTIGENETHYLSRISVSQNADRKWCAAFGSLHDHESESTTDFTEQQTRHWRHQ